MFTEGSTLPETELTMLVDGEMKNLSTHDLFAGKRVVLFAVPGAFTPTCSAAHLPGYVALADKIKAKGVDSIICLSVNDAFVMNAWGESQNASEIMMVADGNASFTEQVGMEMDTDTFGGRRSVRYSMLVENGQVEKLFMEDPGQFQVSDAENYARGAVNTSCALAIRRAHKLPLLHPFYPDIMPPLKEVVCS